MSARVPPLARRGTAAWRADQFRPSTATEAGLPAPAARARPRSWTLSRQADARRSAENQTRSIKADALLRSPSTLDGLPVGVPPFAPERAMAQSRGRGGSLSVGFLEVACGGFTARAPSSTLTA